MIRFVSAVLEAGAAGNTCGAGRTPDQIRAHNLTQSVRQWKGFRSYANVDAEHAMIMAIRDVCGGGFLACIGTGGARQAGMYTPGQSNREYGSVEISREIVQKCEVRNAKLT